ncbi:hypothetical protein B0H17DRAFT_1170992 [Mycena rosella]|uniref:Senescence domain-containing protein n=1 Tax=Mycena rosella TaxID=1033263 RepID=A0AAD7CZA5_MYCRO|nr:hypothetical protein B0H17DRAFT_1170992 [Mycena rosella]
MATTSYEADAFLLLNVSNCSLSANTTHQSGTLALECVTMQVPGAPTGAGADRHVYLVLRLNDTEIPIDPTRVIQTNFSESGSRKYTFLGSEADPVPLVLTVTMPKIPDAHFLEDIDVFESILAQYADLQGVSNTEDMVNPNIHDKADSKELRGHLVLVDQDNGEVVGEFDKKFSVQEDPALSKKGHEGDPVVIEINEYNDGNVMEMFARAIPPEQQDWITKGATIISHAISGSTTLLLTAISAGSTYYTSHSKPSAQPAASGSSSGSSAPPLPPRAVAFLSSARTRKGLAAVQSVSGEAVKVSAKTVEIIDGMIKQALGSSKGKGRQTLGSRTPLPSRAPSPSSLAPPPPYTSSPAEKPPLPPRRQPSPAPSSSTAPPSLPPRTKTGSPMESLPQQGHVAIKLTTTARILLSADLILSTIDNSARRLLDSGTENLGAVVGHKYGAEAGESSVMMAGTARNVALVYIDMRGIGRKALLRRAGKEFVKGRVSDHMARKTA